MTSPRKFDTGIFRAFDGEGCEQPDSNGLGLLTTPQYLLLACSDGTHVYNSSGLGTAQCFEFLLSKTGDDRAINVMYGLSYDANMMMIDLTKKELKQVWENKTYRGVPVLKGSYVIKYVPRKSFRVSDRAGRSITLWDVIGFFQTSFVQAMMDWCPDHPLLETIRAGKAQRGLTLFDRGLNYVLAYTQAEMMALVEIMERLRRALTVADLPVRRWDGAGAIAASMLGRYYQRRPLPPSIASVAYEGYYGGRSETYGIGTLEGPLYQYDLRSAYPAAMASLPDIEGRWRKVDRFIPGKIGLYQVKWRCDDHIGPFPLRDSYNQLSFPQQGTAWQWSPEIEAALEHGVTVTVLEGLALECNYDSRAFAFIPELYQQRQEWRRQGVAAQAVLKLGLNSLYGKLAQSIGYDPLTGRLPPYHNPVYAGLTTSITRAAIYRAMMQAPHQIAYCATDGIASSTPLSLELGSGLGQWEARQYDGLKLVQSGIYCWLVDGVWEYHYRGLDGGSLTVEALNAAWRRGDVTLPLPHTRFMGLGLALASKQMEVWRRFVTTSKVLNITGYAEFKREIWESTTRLHERWVPSSPQPDGGTGRPYVPKWGTGAQWARAVRRGGNGELLMAKLEDMEAD